MKLVFVVVLILCLLTIEFAILKNVGKTCPLCSCGVTRDVEVKTPDRTEKLAPTNSSTQLPTHANTTTSTLISTKELPQLILPDMTLVIRTYFGSIPEYWRIFALSTLLFWPTDIWKTVIVLDDESIRDHHMGNVISALPPYPAVKFEKLPKDVICGNWGHHTRSPGFERSMFSNFFGDMQTESEFVAITDTDGYFITKVLVTDLFPLWPVKKPRMLAYNGCCYGWEKSNQEVIGFPPMGVFMTHSGLPFIMKRSHFADMRNLIKQRLHKSTFGEAFHYICSKYGSESQYSQYDLMGNYLWYYKREEYDWHIINYTQSPVFSRSMTNDPEVLNKSTPIVGVAKMAFTHIPAEQDVLFDVLSDFVCVASNWSHSSCPQELQFAEDITQTVAKNLLTNFFTRSASWNKRMMPNPTPPLLMPLAKELVADEYLHLVYDRKLFPNNLHKVIETITLDNL